MPCRFGSPQGVFSAGTGAVVAAAGAWANVPVVDIKTVTPTAVAAVTTVIVEPMKRSSMMISFSPRIGLPFSAEAGPASAAGNLRGQGLDRQGQGAPSDPAK
jgi:hypothetical protein